METKVGFRKWRSDSRRVILLATIPLLAILLLLPLSASEDGDSTQISWVSFQPARSTVIRAAVRMVRRFLSWSAEVYSACSGAAISL